MNLIEELDMIFLSNCQMLKFSIFFTVAF
jgi:hypothetical protein